MPVKNLYFSHGTRSEKFLYEDLMIEQLKVFGQEVIYLPREIVSKDDVLGDAISSKFESAYTIEMYVDNVSGFEGDQDQLTKFGLEVRDDVTLIVSKRRFDILVDQKSNVLNINRPKEGDAIYMPLFKKMFQIEFVEDEDPFYQIADIPLYKLRCTTFEYNQEEFNTDVTEVDAVETARSLDLLQYQFSLEVGTGTTGSIVLESPSLAMLTLDGTDENGSNAGDSLVLDRTVAGTDTDAGDDILLEDDLGEIMYLLQEDNVITDNNDLKAQNKTFADEAENDFTSEPDIFDFTEANPFGGPKK